MKKRYVIKSLSKRSAVPYLAAASEKVGGLIFTDQLSSAMKFESRAHAMRWVAKSSETTGSSWDEYDPRIVAVRTITLHERIRRTVRASRRELASEFLRKSPGLCMSQETRRWIESIVSSAEEVDA